MEFLKIMIILLIILSAIWCFIVFIGWALLPFTLKKELKNIASKIEELKKEE